MPQKINTAKGAKNANTAGKQATSGPAKKGQLLTSEKSLIQSTPARAEVQNGVASNYPLTFGVGKGGKIPASGGPKGGKKRNGRRSQY